MKVIKTFWKVLIIITLFLVMTTPMTTSKAAPQESEPDRVANPVESRKECKPKWTGRWIITYHSNNPTQSVRVCRLYVPSFIDNEHDAQQWRWSPEYIADNCSLPGDAQTWQGTFVSVRKEMIKVCTWKGPIPKPT